MKKTVVQGLVAEDTVNKKFEVEYLTGKKSGIGDLQPSLCSDGSLLFRFISLANCYT